MEILSPNDIPEEARELGEPVASFKAGAGMFVLYLTLGILAVLLAGGAIVVFVVALLEPGQGRRNFHGGKLIALVLGIGFGGIAAIVKAVTMRGLHVFVFVRGLARRQRDKVEMLRWDEINKVIRRKNSSSHELSIRSPFQLVLEASDGRQWVFDERLSGLRELRQLVEESTLKFMLSPAIEAFDAGAAIGFGEVSIDDQGLHRGKKSVSWDVFEDAKVEQGELVVCGKNQRKPLWRIDLVKVPNAHVLAALTEYVRARRA
jgi:hypothetical protein